MSEISGKQSCRVTKATPMPDRPYQMVGADLFVYVEKNYVVVTDYYSLYPQVCKLHTITAETVITSMKAIFSWHSVPSEVFTEIKPQFAERLGTVVLTSIKVC